jgi:hypothetical protein
MPARHGPHCRWIEYSRWGPVRDSAEIQLGSRRDDQIVVRHLAFGSDHSILLRLDPVRRGVDKLDPFLFQYRPKLKTDVFPCPPPDGDPGIRRHEMKGLDIGDDRDLVFLREKRPRLIGRR